jgi:hypothetical protein
MLDLVDSIIGLIVFLLGLMIVGERQAQSSLDDHRPEISWAPLRRNNGAFIALPRSTQKLRITCCIREMYPKSDRISSLL